MPEQDDPLLKYLLSGGDEFATDDLIDAALAHLAMAMEVSRDQHRLARELSELMPAEMLETFTPERVKEQLRRELEKVKEELSAAELTRVQQKRARKPRGRSARATALEARIIEQWHQCEREGIPEHARVSTIMERLRHERIYRRQIDRAIRHFRTLTG